MLRTKSEPAVKAEGRRMLVGMSPRICIIITIIILIALRCCLSRKRCELRFRRLFGYGLVASKIGGCDRDDSGACWCFFNHQIRRDGFSRRQKNERLRLVGWTAHKSGFALDSVICCYPCQHGILHLDKHAGGKEGFVPAERTNQQLHSNCLLQNSGAPPKPKWALIGPHCHALVCCVLLLQKEQDGNTKLSATSDPVCFFFVFREAALFNQTERHTTILSLSFDDLLPPQCCWSCINRTPLQ